MAEIIPPGLKEELEKAAHLHQRASSNFEKCQEFQRQMSDLLGQLEEAGCYKTADRVMSILIECNPKPGSRATRPAASAIR